MAENPDIRETNLEESADQSTPKPKKKHSYDSVCGKCGALLPAGKETCIVCRTPRDAVPFQGNFPVEPSSSEPVTPVLRRDGTSRKTPDLWRRWVGSLAGVVLVLLISVTGFGVYREYFDTSSYRAVESVIYESAGGYLLSNPTLEEPKPIEGIASGRKITDVRASPSGRWMACKDDRGTLYLVDLAQRMMDGDALVARELATDLAEAPAFTRNSGYLIYRTTRDELFASDFSENWQLDTYVMEVTAVDENKVLYTRRGDEPGQLDLYWEQLSRNSGQRNVIARNVVEVVDYNQGLNRVLYTGMRQNEDGEEKLCLQLFELGQSTTVTLAEGVGEVLDASAERNAAIYLMPQELPWDYQTFVNDDYAMRDLVLREPQIEDYPLVEEAFALYVLEEDFPEDADNDDFQEELSLYREATERWEDKLHRDTLREAYARSIQRTKDSLQVGDLYVYHNGESTLLDTGVILGEKDGTASASRGYVVYEKVDTAELTRIQMSAVDRSTRPSDFSPVDYYLDMSSRQLMFAAVGSSPTTLFIHTSSSTYRQWMVSPSGDSVYFLISNAAQSSQMGDDLYYAPVRTGQPAEATLLRRGVVNLRWPFRDGILFEAGQQDGARLYYVQQGDVQELSGLASEALAPEATATSMLYYGEDRDLYQLVREERLIARQVEDYAYIGDELIYLLRGGAQNGMELTVWISGRERLIATEVTTLLWAPA